MSKVVLPDAGEHLADAHDPDHPTFGEWVRYLGATATGIVGVVGGGVWLQSNAANIGRVIDGAASHVRDFTWGVMSHVPNLDHSMTNLANAPAWQWAGVGILTLVACIREGVVRLREDQPAQPQSNPAHLANEQLAEQMFTGEYETLEAFAARYMAGESGDDAIAA